MHKAVIPPANHVMENKARVQMLPACFKQGGVSHVGLAVLCLYLTSRHQMVIWWTKVPNQAMGMMNREVNPRRTIPRAKAIVEMIAEAMTSRLIVLPRGVFRKSER
jgi:hypothetical protein